MTADDLMLRAERLSKTFTLHNQGGVVLDVLDDVTLDVARGECLVLGGPSGTGKSTLLRSLYANYLPQTGHVFVRHAGEWVDLVGAEPHTVMEVRRRTLGYVSQFLRVIPRIATLDLVMEPLLDQGVPEGEARDRASAMLDRLAIPERLWSLPPATFSGGEQQRVNIAITLVQDYPILLLDEPTASLDAGNRDTVTALIDEARDKGAAIVGIFHDQQVRDAVGTRLFDLADTRKVA